MGAGGRRIGGARPGPQRAPGGEPDRLPLGGTGESHACARRDLRREADLSIIELLPRLGRHADALAETQRFVSAHPRDERRGELHLLRGNIYREAFRDLARAQLEYGLGAAARGRAGDDSRFFHAVCLEALGKTAAARAAYQAYLDRRDGAHRAEVSARLSGCSSMTVVGTSSATAGAACLVQVTSTDGRRQTVALSVEAKVMPFTCCGYPTDGHGVWIAPTALSFSPGTVTVDFAADGGAGSATSCAECAATEVCVQSFDGMCGGGRVACKAVSETCRTKLSASGAKSCKSIPECESELCLTPSYRCTYDAPCGSEAKEAQVYCYGI